MKYILSLTLLAVLLCAPLAPADEPTSEPATHSSTATLTVKTCTAAGAGVHCDVTLRGKAYHKSGATDGDGVFVFVDVPPGNYEIFINAHLHGSSQTKTTLKAGDFPILTVTIPD